MWSETHYFCVPWYIDNQLYILGYSVSATFVPFNLFELLDYFLGYFCLGLGTLHFAYFSALPHWCFSYFYLSVLLVLAQNLIGSLLYAHFFYLTSLDPDSLRAFLTFGAIGVGQILASILAALAYCHTKSRCTACHSGLQCHTELLQAVSSTGSRYTASLRHSGSCYTELCSLCLGSKQLLQFVESYYNSGSRESVVNLGFFSLFFCCFSNPFSIGECGGVNV